MSDSDQYILPDAPDDFIDRVINDEEKALLDTISKQKDHIIKLLEGRSPKTKQAAKEIVSFRSNLDKLAELVHKSIDALDHPDSIMFLKDKWSNEEYEFVQWVDDKDRTVELQEEELKMTSPPIQSLDDQIKSTRTSLTNKIKKNKDLLKGEDYTLAQCNLVSRVCKDVREEVNTIFHSLYSQKATQLPLNSAKIMQAFTANKEDIFALLDQLEESLEEAMVKFCPETNISRNDTVEDESEVTDQVTVVTNNSEKDPPASTAESTTVTPPIPAKAITVTAASENAGVSKGLVPPKPSATSSQRLTAPRPMSSVIDPSRAVNVPIVDPNISAIPAVSREQGPPQQSQGQQQSQGFMLQPFYPQQAYPSMPQYSYMSYPFSNPYYPTHQTYPSLQPQPSLPPSIPNQTGVYEHMGGLSKIYQRRKMPTFDGTDLLAFPAWLNEWKSIAKYYSEADVIQLLDEHTPKSLNLRNNDTVQQCWEDLCNRYMNPNATCSQVVKSSCRSRG